MPTAAETVDRCPLFASLSTKARARLAADLRERRYAAGDAMTSEDQGGVGFFLIGEGTADVHVGEQRAGRRRSAPATRSARWRSSPARRAAPRITAQTDVQCWVLSQWHFKPLVLEHPRAGLGAARDPRAPGARDAGPQHEFLRRSSFGARPADTAGDSPARAASFPVPLSSGAVVNTTRKALLSALVVGVLGSVVALGAFSAFSSQTSNSGNTFTAGTVNIEDNDSDGAMYQRDQPEARHADRTPASASRTPAR